MMLVTTPAPTVRVMRYSGNRPSPNSPRRIGVASWTTARRRSRSRIAWNPARPRSTVYATAAAPVEKAAGYLVKHTRLLHYDRALADGLPIATGVIEGACRYLVQDRMGRTGARWSASASTSTIV